MKIIILIFAFVIILNSGALAVAPSVIAEKGDIYYSIDGNIKTRLTRSGIDRAPVLSPDGTKIVFIRKSKETAYDPVDGGESGQPGLADQIWLINSNGSNERMLVQDYDPDAKVGYGKWKGEDVVGYIEDQSLQFSPDGNIVYFLTPAWVTSSALRAVNINGSNHHFVAAANSLEVIKQGGYKGYLIISQHRYFVAGGSYDWYYVFGPDGKEIGPLGDDMERVDREFLFSEDIK